MKIIAPHYSPSIKSGHLIFSSGLLPLLNRETKEVPLGIILQTTLVLQKAEEICASYGLNRNNIIKTTAFITEVNDWDMVNEVYADFFQNHKPARSVIPVSSLHFGCLIELEFIAEIL